MTFSHLLPYFCAYLPSCLHHSVSIDDDWANCDYSKRKMNVGWNGKEEKRLFFDANVLCMHGTIGYFKLSARERGRLNVGFRASQTCTEILKFQWLTLRLKLVHKIHTHTDREKKNSVCRLTSFPSHMHNGIKYYVLNLTLHCAPYFDLFFRLLLTGTVVVCVFSSVSFVLAVIKTHFEFLFIKRGFSR